MAAGLEADAVDSGVDLGHSEDLLDLVGDVALGDVDGLAPEALRLREPLGVQVSDDDGRCTEELRRGRAGQADGARAGDVHGRAGSDSRGDRTVITRREDVREHGAAAHHVLVAAADVGRDDLQDDAVLAFAAHVLWIHPRSIPELELRIVDGLDFHLPRSDVGYGFVPCHLCVTSPSRALASEDGYPRPLARPWGTKSRFRELRLLPRRRGDPVRPSRR